MVPLQNPWTLSCCYAPLFSLMRAVAGRRSIPELNLACTESFAFRNGNADTDVAAVRAVDIVATRGPVELPPTRLYTMVCMELQIPIHRGQSFRRIADSVPVIADSFR